MVRFGQILAFLVHLVPCPTNKMPWWFLMLCGCQNFCFLLKKLGFWPKKRPNLAQNMLWCHVGWWLWCAGVSRKTPIYFMLGHGEDWTAAIKTISGRNPGAYKQHSGLIWAVNSSDVGHSKRLFLYPCKNVLYCLNKSYQTLIFSSFAI